MEKLIFSTFFEKEKMDNQVSYVITDTKSNYKFTTDKLDKILNPSFDNLRIVSRGYLQRCFDAFSDDESYFSLPDVPFEYLNPEVFFQK